MGEGALEGALSGLTCGFCKCFFFFGFATGSQRDGVLFVEDPTAEGESPLRSCSGAVICGWRPETPKKPRFREPPKPLSPEPQTPRDSKSPQLRNIPHIIIRTLMRFKVYSLIKGFWSLWAED